MFNNDSAPSVADIAAVTNGGGGWGNGFGEGWWAIIIILALFGWGRGGMFGGNGGIGCGCDSACATVGDVERGFNQQSNNQQFAGIANGISQLGYANQQQAFDVVSAINAAQAAQQQCCCDTQRAIDGVNYNMAQGFCNVGNVVQQGFAQAGYNSAMNTNNIIQSQHADADRVIAKLDAMETARLQDRIHSLESENTSLKFQASQSAQNAFITANQDAQTAEILRRTGHDCPTAAYVVQPPTPVTFPNYGCCGTQSCC